MFVSALSSGIRANIDLMRLSHIGEYVSENESLKLAVNSPKNCE